MKHAHHYLMCPPDYFSIQYSINPWMHPEQSFISTESKVQQWNQLRETFEKSGVEVSLLTPQPGLPDMVYTDVGVIWENTFIPSNFKFPERQPERGHFIEWFKAQGYRIEEIDSAFSFEGHGDTLWAGKNLYCGHGFRTSVEAHQALREIFARLGADANIIPVELVDDRFYHLDTTFCPLSETRALIFKNGVSSESFAMLQERMELIEVSEEDARKFACNAVIVENHILIPSGATATNQTLRNLGYEVHEIEMGEFIKGGGACKCLSMPLA